MDWNSTIRVTSKGGIAATMKQMNLKDFVAETLEQIVEGVKVAQEHAKELGAKINPTGARRSGRGSTVRTFPKANVEFDVALTVAEGKNVKGGGGMNLGVVAIGAKGHSEIETSSVSRVRFSVALILPPGPEM